ncbi:MAG: hypothetical protein NTX82_02905 [Candidatus Parcubacteria bacterium]|nr:hypothetical protein [Candidatus Parcubacteria bacterium]
MPIFCFPISLRFAAYSKILIFYICVVAVVVVWLVKIYTAQKINWQGKILDLPVFLFLFVYFLASIFSIDRYQSFIGINLTADFSLLTVLFLGLFYLLISRFITTNREIRRLIVCLLAAIFIIALNYLINWLLPAFPVIFLGIGLNTFGFLLILGFFLSLLLVLLKIKYALIYKLQGLFFLVFLFLLDKQYYLLILIIGIFLVIFLLSLKSKIFSEKLVIGLTVILFICVVVSILPIGKITNIASVNQLSLPISFGWQITRGVLADNLLLGVGPQNFSYSFYRYKPLAYNQTNFWQLGFEKNYNFWLEILNNIGFLGFAFLVILLSIYLFNFFSFVSRLQILDEYMEKKYLITAFVAIIISSLTLFGCFYSFDFMLGFLFFLFMALGASSLETINPENNFGNKNIISAFVFVSLIILVCFGYYGVKIVQANIYIEKALALNYDNEQSFGQGKSYLENAIVLNPGRTDYYLKLVRLDLNQIAFLVNQKQTLNDATIFEEIKKNLDLVNKKGSQQIGDIYELAKIYADLNNLGLEVGTKPKEMNELLLQLDSNNPELYIDRALLTFDEYIAIKNSQVVSEDRVAKMGTLSQEIKADLEKSLELKDNYVLGYYNLGLYYQEIGEQNKTMENMIKAWEIDPSQKIVALTLKKLYLNQDKVTEAIGVLTKYLELVPADNETRLELAGLFQDNNETVKAKEEANKVLELDPNNAEAQKFIK